MSKIPGVKLIDLNRLQDDRGFLYEVLHDYDIEAFGQSYISGNWSRKVVRGFHRHFEQWDYFHVLSGAALFALVYQPDYQMVGDMMIDTVIRAVSSEPIIETFVLSSDKPQVLVVSPQTWHGWMSLKNETLIMNTVSQVYNQEHPDEERTNFDAWGDDVWKVKAR